MADNFTNTFTFGDIVPEIMEICEAIKDDNVGIGSIDFNKIIPMPEELKIVDGSDMIKGYNWYKDFVDVYTLMGTRKDVDLLNIPQKSEEVFLNARKDIPRDVFLLGKRTFNNEIKFGVKTSFDWCLKHWGTSKNAFDYEKSDVESLKRTGLIRFQTAGTTPSPILIKLSQMYPNIEIEHQWASEKVGESCGSTTYKSGKIIEEYEPNSNVESVEFAVYVMGYEYPENLGYTINSDKTKYLNVIDEEFDVIEVNGVTALFNNGRFAKDEIPIGLYSYDLRFKDDGVEVGSIEPNVLVNHAGSILTSVPIDFGDKGVIVLSDDTSPNFLGEEKTILDFINDEYIASMDEVKM